jgi:hypothetical protein
MKNPDSVMGAKFISKIRILLSSFVKRYGSGSDSGSFYHHAKIVRKTLWSYFFVTLFFQKISSLLASRRSMTKIAGSNPLVRGMDPRIRIHTKCHGSATLYTIRLFFYFLSRFCAFGFNVWKAIWPKNKFICLNQERSQNALYFILISNPMQKFLKNALGSNGCSFNWSSGSGSGFRQAIMIRKKEK